ncbi:anthranilate synthase component I [Alteribacillus sp. HJP-4]|uniref:anthranilate synthase component I n=1 Tax=Alteribacillus sp. HJP-4 TaxID=2775394 RepID=UPI0035CCE27E
MTETTEKLFTETASAYRMVPYVRTFFTDTLTPIEIFRKLERDAVFILESKDEASPWSRYSFIGLTPNYRITELNGEYSFVDKDNNPIKQSSSLASIFDEAISWLHPATPEVQVPFKGGAVGVVSYDAVERFEPKLSSIQNENTEELVHLIFCETLIALDHESKELTFIHYSDQEESTVADRYAKAKDLVSSCMTALTNGVKKDAFLSPMQPGTSIDFTAVKSNYEKQQFMDDVNKIKDYIRDGDIFQAVLSQRFERKITVSAFDIYRVLRMVNPSPYMFYLKVGTKEVVGSSPERLVQVQDGHMEIHPIAGTRKRGATIEEDQALMEDLLQDDKERAEHYMLVDLARNDVGRVAEYGSVETPVLLEIGKFSHVMHIISKVTGKISDQTKAVDALQASFPAGTVSGAPKIRAMEILKELEPDKRGMYAGAVCYMGFDGNLDSCIAIRTMIIEEGKAKIQAGAGIVADSVPENEYEETRNKAAALIKAVETAEQMFSRDEEEKRIDKEHSRQMY